MLKARKKITKKEIKHDPFLETIYKSKEYFEENQKLITRVGIGIILIVIIGIVFSNNLKNKRESSEAALGKALVNLSTGDRDYSLLQLELLVEDYSGTEAAQRGLFILARIYYEQKDFLTATSYLQDFLNEPTKEFHSGALMMMANIDKINGNTTSVENYIKMAMKKASNDAEKDKYSLDLAEYYVSIGMHKDARELAELMLEKYERRSEIYNKSAEILGHLHTVVTDEQ